MAFRIDRGRGWIASLSNAVAIALAGDHANALALASVVA